MHQLHISLIVLLLCIHGPALAETQGMHNGQARLAVPVEKKGVLSARKIVKIGKPATSPQKNSRSAQGSKYDPSHFVRLAQLIINNTAVFDTFNDFGVNAFHSATIDSIFGTREARWGLISADLRHKEYSSPLHSSRNSIPTQLVALDLDSFNPRHVDFSRPLIRGQFVLSAEDLAPLSKGVDLDSAPLFATGEPLDDPEKSATNLPIDTKSSPFSFRYVMDKKTSLNVGIDWIPNLGGTGGIPIELTDPWGEYSSAKALTGVNFNLGARYKAVTLTGGYIRTLDNHTFAELAFESKESEPVVWSSELAYSTRLLSRETSLAIGYQKSSDALQNLPEERYSTRASVTLSKSTSINFEYYQDKDYATTNGEEDGYGISTWIGFDF